jgi:hypothetical protein
MLVAFGFAAKDDQHLLAMIESVLSAHPLFSAFYKASSQPETLQLLGLSVESMPCDKQYFTEFLKCFEKSNQTLFGHQMFTDSSNRFQNIQTFLEKLFEKVLIVVPWTNCYCQSAIASASAART